MVTEDPHASYNNGAPPKTATHDPRKATAAAETEQPILATSKSSYLPPMKTSGVPKNFNTESSNRQDGRLTTEATDEENYASIRSMGLNDSNYADRTIGSIPGLHYQTSS